jgi:FlaA1/EpsC-like NDP-sugar epimerase
MDGLGVDHGQMMNDLTAIATGRNQSLFAADVDAQRDAIDREYAGKRLLVIGGAGSIGSATIRALMLHGPTALHVLDHDENGLAELVRDLRSSGLAGGLAQIRLMPLDYGAPVARQFLRRAGPYDAVLHFAAMKHVRSEKDAASVLHMIDTNVLKQRRLLEWLGEDGAPTRYFAVSTDKAADPVNFMGASKRLMEHLLFTDALSPIRDTIRTSARFANVAFSAGSLLESFGERLRRRQPLAVPRDTRRYFVSLEESGHICLLASALLPGAQLAIPRLQQASDMRELIPIAEAFLKSSGFRPVPYDDERSARAAVERDAAKGGWPLLVTPRDTDGEKRFEEFVGTHESSKEIGLKTLLAVPQHGIDASTLDATLHQLRQWTEDQDASPTKADIGRVLAAVIPEFQHISSGRTLDDRM